MNRFLFYGVAGWSPDTWRDFRPKWMTCRQWKYSSFRKFISMKLIKNMNKWVKSNEDGLISGSWPGIPSLVPAWTVFFRRHFDLEIFLEETCRTFLPVLKIASLVLFDSRLFPKESGFENWRHIMEKSTN